MQAAHYPLDPFCGRIALLAHQNPFQRTLNYTKLYRAILAATAAQFLITSPSDPSLADYGTVDPETASTHAITPQKAPRKATPNTVNEKHRQSKQK